MEADGEGWWSRQIVYGDAVYAARCPECARFVKCDDKAIRRGILGEAEAAIVEPNATCRTHGRIITPFLCWVSDGDY